MTDLHAIADRFEIEALRGEFVDACMMRDYDWFASLFTPDGAWRMPDINVEFVSRVEIRAGIERMQDHRDYFMPSSHLGTIEVDGDTATGSDYICDFGQPRDGRSQLQYSLYYDHYQRTPDGWKFTERVYETRYLDATPVAGSAPRGPLSGLPISHGDGSAAAESGDQVDRRGQDDRSE